MHTETRSKVAYVVLAFLCIAFASVSSMGMGLFFLSTFSVAIFSYLLVTEKLYKVIYIPIVSALVSLILTQSKIRALISILFIIPAIAVTLMLFVKASNSTILIGLSFFYTFIFLLSFIAFVQIAYGDFRTGYQDIIYQIRLTINNALNDTDLPWLYIELIRQSVHLIKMSFLGLFILGCQVFALLSAMLLKLLGIINKSRVYSESPWHVEFSVIGSVILLISAPCSLILSGESVIYYVFVNLTYILLMFGTLVGVRSMFGKASRFRKAGSKTSKVLTLVFCGLLLYVSPILLCIYLSLRGALFSIFTALNKARMKKMNDNDNDDEDNEE